MPKRRKPKVNAKGRNSGGRERFVHLPHRLMKSSAYRSLSLKSRALLVELIMLDNGSNNGSLYLSLRDAADRLGMSDLTSVSGAFDELIDRGLLKCTKEAHFHVKAAEHSRARCWTLTWLRADKRAPTNDWEKYEPPTGLRERKRMERGMKALKRYYRALTSHRLPVLESGTQSDESAKSSTSPVLETRTGNPQKDANPSFGVDRVSTAHTAATITMRTPGEWWRDRIYFRLPDRTPRASGNDN